VTQEQARVTCRGGADTDSADLQTSHCRRILSMSHGLQIHVTTGVLDVTLQLTEVY